MQMIRPWGKKIITLLVQAKNPAEFSFSHERRVTTENKSDICQNRLKSQLPASHHDILNTDIMKSAGETGYQS